VRQHRAAGAAFQAQARSDVAINCKRSVEPMFTSPTAIFANSRSRLAAFYDPVRQ